ncbi:MAG: hypothetical protein IT353_04130 [Gemmatimonadaceae bacterium]|nr:hypothetical protein [Gemmatimonadaceae bacterium]
MSLPSMVDARSDAEPLRFGRIVVIGGGCYGSWYTQQLTRAMVRGALVADSIVVVDRDPQCLVAQRLSTAAYEGAPVHLVVDEWAAYLNAWLSTGVDALRDDAMVPSPLMPHLCLDWLMTRAVERWPHRAVRVEPLAVTPPMPWERAAPDGRHYVSFATWTCPVNCIEPVTCPATRGPRDWSMSPALASYVAERGVGIDIACIFHCAHRTYGVGMIDASAIAAGDQQLALAVHARPNAPIRALVGTVSHCHGALGVLAVE